MKDKPNEEKASEIVSEAVDKKERTHREARVEIICKALERHIQSKDMPVVQKAVERTLDMTRQEALYMARVLSGELDMLSELTR